MGLFVFENIPSPIFLCNFFALVLLTESRDDEVYVHLGGHVHQSPPEAVVGEDQEDLPQDKANSLQLLVLKVLKDEGGHGGNDADEEVRAAEGHEGGGGHGEGERGRVHQGDGGEPVQGHDDKQGGEVVRGNVGLRKKMNNKNKVSNIAEEIRCCELNHY